jgi:hypothetical protein
MIARAGEAAKLTAFTRMSALKRLHSMSALPPKADIAERDRNVRFVPLTDIGGIIR